ncbi:MAG: FAD-dependent oxidoreductase, partial [Actinomycetales bacterium]
MNRSTSSREATVADGPGNNFDIVILGGGSGGYATALRAAQLGKSVALVEKGKLGGTCLHNGCVPTKALLHAAEVADAARESGTFGVKATFEGIDMPQVNAYKDGVIGGLYKGLQGLIKAAGITVVEGEGRLTGPKTVTVDGQEYTGENLVLATGSYARTLPGLE